MVPSGLLRRVTLVRTDVSEEPGASFIRVTKIIELPTTKAATSNRRTLPHGVTTQNTPFFIVTAVKTSNLTTNHWFAIEVHDSAMRETKVGARVFQELKGSKGCVQQSESLSL
jgi:hypothetical protein